MEIAFDLRTEGEALPDAFLDPYELEMMFDSARQSIRAGLERKIGDMTCAEHGHAPKFLIAGRYDHASEQMDIQYHVDTCCRLFLLDVMRMLNRQN